MEAYSPNTDTIYPSWDALVSAEAHGFITVAILQHRHPKTGKTTTYARAFGPFSERRLARNKAAVLRRRWKVSRDDERPGLTLVKVATEPLWGTVPATTRT
ncbi:hypothetical protein [Amycolatopsis sp. TNS106]|uniref:hypothetical protein n=1 Tax=Amycolatopsis sp. TNS106 TaxID=2861750 RepID=UPI001C586914|nr:hypothetical protein [Amycolatopsis sp. TNS106]QXV57409.1 hypothetical protein CVV72_10665 [Amycolatopsis sp. TNS106]